MAATAPADFAKILFRTAPFNRMSSARRFQLLSQARSMHFAEGEQLFPEDQPPTDVCMLLEGTVCVFAELSGETEPIFLEELGPGACVGWTSALSGTAGIRAVATTDVVALYVAAPIFFETARHDPVLRGAIFKHPHKDEVWRAVAREIERRKIGAGSPRTIVEQLTDACVVREWPEEESTIVNEEDRLWIVSGGVGVKCGERWGDTKGVKWARLIGLPAEQFSKALSASRSSPARESQRSRPNISASRVVKMEPDSSASGDATARAAKEQAVSQSRSRGVLHAVTYTLLAILFLLVGVAAWARRQPVSESCSVHGTLVFSGDSRDINAAFEGTLIESRIHAGQRVERGTVLAVIRPPFDAARAKDLADTRDRARAQADFCDGVISGRAVKSALIPPALSELAREHAAQLSELRVQTAIRRGGSNVAGLSADERKRVAAHFSALRENRAENASSVARDIETRREDMKEAEDALREAQSELRVQGEAYSQLRAEKNDDAKEEYAVAQRALSTLKRAVSQRQETVNRIRKEIAAMNVPSEPEGKNTTQGADGFDAANTALAAVESQLHEQSTTLRQLAAESEKTLALLRADNAPRQILAAQRGLVVETRPLAAGTFVKADTLMGRLVTHQSWQVQCRAAQTVLLQPRQPMMLFVSNSDGTEACLSEILDFAPEVFSKNQTLLRLQASRDTWRDGTPVRIEATVVVGTLLDRWLGQLGAGR